MAQRIQVRRDTAANWSSVNPVLSQGEMGLETDTNKVKFGDGTTAWNLLSFFGSGGGTVEGVTGDGVDNTDPNNPVISFPTIGDIGADAAGAAAAAEAAAKSYADTLVVGLWDDRGNFDASVNAYPSSGGSGVAGAIKKGDIWTVSVGGTLPTAQVVEVGDTVRALIDTPGNTQANWSIQQNNIGYTAENSANKESSTLDTSTTKYPSNSLLSKLIPNIHSPKYYGAAGDGITDDTAAVQLAINTGVVYLDTMYLINTANLNAVDGLRMWGAGYLSGLKTTNNQTILNFPAKNCMLSYFSFEGNFAGAAQKGAGIVGDAGLTLNYTSNKFNSVHFKDLLHSGLFIHRVVGTTGATAHQGAASLDNCFFDHCGTGLYLDDRAEYVKANNTTIYNCTVQGYYVSGGNSTWIGGAITECPIGIKVVTGSNDGKGKVSGCSINHCSKAISTTGVLQGFLFDANYFAVSDIELVTSTGIKLKNNTFSTSSIVQTNCTFTSFINNTFRTTPTITRTGTRAKWFLNDFEAGVIPDEVNDEYNELISKRYITGRMYSNSVNGVLLTTQALGANIIRAFPWRVKEQLTIDLFEVNITTGVAGTCRFAIYKDDGNGYPGAIVTNSDAGTYDTTTSATFPQRAPAANIVLNPGLYWVAFNADAGPTLRAHLSVDPVIGAVAGTAGHGIAWSAALAYGAMPANFPAGGTVVTAQSVSCPELKCRAV